ncbi:hypothetical protein B0J12DRAFT_403098 [Macrophomina phaseolina]|uniref:Uncharacterized protein n=1 Tax=Macrophomina phaseolina TaxID=35725 RepID=A0ABQ8GIK0_9PEZI|nr:hypothetical protein B0J12DRAFT_403098 [Macrophomina phaseolina]
MPLHTPELTCPYGLLDPKSLKQMSRSRGSGAWIRFLWRRVVSRKRRALVIWERQLELEKKAGAADGEVETDGLMMGYLCLEEGKEDDYTDSKDHVRQASWSKETPAPAVRSMKAGCNDTLARAGRSRHANPYHICLGSSARWLFFRSQRPCTVPPINLSCFHLCEDDVCLAGYGCPIPTSPGCRHRQPVTLSRLPAGAFRGHGAAVIPCTANTVH